MRRARSIRRFASAAALCGVAAFAAPSAAQALSCGDTIKHDIKLKANLDCSSGGVGLIVGKSNVTINLNGHRILGGGYSDFKNGIYSEGYDNIRVVNGTVKGFYENIYVYGGARPFIGNVRVEGIDTAEGYGVDIEYTGGGVIKDVVAKNLDTGIYVAYGGNNTVNGAVVTETTTGVYGYNETRSRFSNIRVRQGAPDAVGAYDYIGLENVWSHVNVAGAAFNFGVYIDYPGAVKLTRSVVKNTGDIGVYIDDNDLGDGYRATVTRTKSNGNENYAMYAGYAGTIGSGNTAFGNRFGCYQVPCN